MASRTSYFDQTPKGRLCLGMTGTARDVRNSQTHNLCFLLHSPSRTSDLRATADVTMNGRPCLREQTDRSDGGSTRQHKLAILTQLSTISDADWRTMVSSPPPYFFAALVPFLSHLRGSILSV